MTIEFDITGPEIDETNVVDFEESLGRRLPSGYRQFLQTMNGGDPEVNHHPASDPIGGVGVRLFLSLGTDDRYKSLAGYRDVYDGRVPEEFLVIGYDSGSNLILINLGDDDLGAISFWDHDWEAEEDEPATYRNITRISDSFTAFLEELEPYERPGRDPAWIAEYRRTHGLDT